MGTIIGKSTPWGARLPDLSHHPAGSGLHLEDGLVSATLRQVARAAYKGVVASSFAAVQIWNDAHEVLEEGSAGGTRERFAELLVPILLDNEHVGVIQLYARPPHHMTASDALFVKDLALLVSTALSLRQAHNSPIRKIGLGDAISSVSYVSGEFSINVRYVGAQLTLAARGELSARTSSTFERALTQAVNDSVSDLWLDVEQLNVIDDRGFQTVSAAHELLAFNHRRLLTINVNGSLQDQLLELGGADALQAIGALSNSGN